MLGWEGRDERIYEDPCVSRSFHSLQEEISMLKETTCATQFGSNHTGFSFIACTVHLLSPHFESLSHCLLCRGGRKSSRIFPFITCVQITAFLVSLSPFFSPQAPSLLPSDTEYPYTKEPAPAHLPATGSVAKHTSHQAACRGLPKTHTLSSLCSQKQDTVQFWTTGMEANLYTC